MLDAIGFVRNWVDFSCDNMHIPHGTSTSICIHFAQEVVWQMTSISGLFLGSVALRHVPFAIFMRRRRDFRKAQVGNVICDIDKTLAIFGLSTKVAQRGGEDDDTRLMRLCSIHW